MTLALTFVTPLLLIGVLAAAIPFLLHLLSSVRAQEVYFPTLRFLRVSMEKTARRRRIQHWLLLVLRALLLGVLAMAVAEPISQATGGWLSGRRYAAAIVLDNSMSMGVKSGSSTRFARAKDAAASLLAGEDRPALAAVLTTNGPAVSSELTARFDNLRAGIAKTALAYGRAPIARRVAAAVEMLQGESAPRKAIYLFSDLQRISFEKLASLDTLARSKDVHLLVINTAGAEVGNVGISDLKITGQRVVDQALEFEATLVNSSPTDRIVDVVLRVEGRQVGQRIRQNLRAAGKEGSSAAVHFYHRFSQAGAVGGQVIIEQADDLAADNIRRFALRIGGRVNVLVVRGSAAVQTPALDPAAMLLVALDPYGQADAPWSILPRIIEAERFAPEHLDAVDAAFFCEVPAFTSEQAGGIERFARQGGTVVFFLGEDVQPDNYNESFIQQIQAEGGLLPMRLVEATGEVGPAAPAKSIDWVDVAHPYFEGLYENQADYLTVLVQRYFRLGALPRSAQVLMRLTGGDPLLVTKSFGRGRVTLSATTASPRWSNLPATGLFLPMVVRASLLARQELSGDPIHLAGSKVTIRPIAASGGGATELDEEASVVVTPPPRGADQPAGVSVPLRKTSEGYVAQFDGTDVPGEYPWRVVTASGRDVELAGTFVVNANGQESNLESIPPEAFVQMMAKGGAERVYVSDSLSGVHEAAATDAQGRNWWDILLAGVILLLVAEAIVANRRRSGEEAVPAHLNPAVVRSAGA